MALHRTVQVGHIPPPRPDETNTGYLGDLGDLTPLSGYTVTTPGAVIENRLITGTLYLEAPGIQVRNNVWTDGGFFCIDTGGVATDAVIEDNTMVGGGNCAIAMNADGATVRRNNISDSTDGMKWGGSDGLIISNYIHDLTVGPESHNDGIQCFGPISGLQFINNTIHSVDTSCIGIHNDSWTDILIEDNLMTGTGYILSLANGTDVRVRRNTMGDWGFGPVTNFNPAASGNVWELNIDLDGVPIPA